MLKKLAVSNYAIIDNLEINFSEGLNIITGETGAGKSIIIGALSLILGQRADTKTLFDKNEKCVVEGTFQIGTYDLKDFFSNNDLDYEEETIIRREITPAGKSRAFINDTPVNLSLVKSLGAQLVNLHSQHETLTLSTNLFQLQLVDALVQHDELLAQFGEFHYQYRALQAELKTILDENNAVSDQDYLAFQLNELMEADVAEDENEQLENELKMLEHAEDIKENLSRATELVDQSEHSINNQLEEVSGLLRHIEAFNPQIESVYKRFESCSIELKDIAEELEKLDREINYDPARMQELEERLNLINRLLQKHRVKTSAELILIREELKKKLESFDVINETIEKLRQQISETESHLIELGEKIHHNRAAKSSAIAKQVKEKLGGLGMPNAQFNVTVEELPFGKVNQNGFDKVTFQFSANKGGKADELKHVASGGELSRVMLVLKSLIAAYTDLPTLIFDEIDSGISGEVAIKVGNELETLGQNHQVITITHLPQIARTGRKHFFVYKDIENDRTVTRIKDLSDEERVIEIAKMIGGDQYSDAALENAKELLEF